MKAISVRQPWAWLIVNGHKPVENRTRRTNYRGPVLIHASKTFDLDGYTQLIKDEFLNEVMPMQHEYDMGGIVGQSNIKACWNELMMEAAGTPKQQWWFQGPYGWMLEDSTPLTFMPCKGMLGLFNVDYQSPIPVITNNGPEDIARFCAETIVG
jgi:hypothetical protein